MERVGKMWLSPFTGLVCKQVSPEFHRLMLAGLQTRYITALAGSFSALGEGGTDMEKLYGWYGEIMVGFIFGSIAGVMSQIMTSLKGNDQEFSIKMNGTYRT